MNGCPFYGPSARWFWGALGVGGIGLSDLLRLRAEAANQAQPVPDNLCLAGEWASHMKTYDMEPDAHRIIGTSSIQFAPVPRTPRVSTRMTVLLRRMILWATVYKHLSIDQNATINHYSG
jgi:hypothetical protein